MKIAVLDMVFTSGHFSFNTRVIEIIKKNNSFIAVHNNYYKNSGDEYISCDRLREPSGHFKGRITEYRNIIEEIKVIRNYEIDHIIVCTCDWVVLSFVIKKLLRIAPVALIHHNLNQFDNAIKYSFFSFYKNKVKNIVLDDFCLGPIINNYGVKKNHAFLLRLPQTLFCEYLKSTKRYITQLSGSIDQEILEELFNRRDEIIRSNKYIIVKNQNISYEEGIFRFIKGKIEDVQYNEYFKNSFAIMLAFPRDWNYRVSTLAISAMMSHKIIICNSNEFTRALKNKFPSIVQIYSNVDELVYIINNLPDFATEEMERDFNNAISDRSEETLENQIKAILYG